jgi:Type II secretion system (T2SS), protein N
MPASRSPNSHAKAAPRSRSYWPLVLIGLAAVLAVVVSSLPASIVTRFLPPEVHAEDFSGSIWHGSAGKISVNAHDIGALEWRLHPAALPGMQVSADVHWVKVAFVVDAAVNADRQGFSAQAVKGGGPIEDLRDFGVAAGWHGMADINFSELKSDWVRPLAAVGDIKVSNLTSPQIAEGADLGGYDLRLAAGAVAADGSVTAQLADAGGPLEMKAVISLSTKERTGMLSGTLRERPEAPPALLSDLEGLVQLRGRDSQGRIPVDLEFTW